MDFRKREQYLALTKWKENNYLGTALCCTGFGKTYLGILAACWHIKQDKSQKWLVLVPTINLISQWREEAYKWGYGIEWDKNVECVCYQSAYKYLNNHYSGIIADEIHVGLSPEYRKIFVNNTYDKLLCLTATEPENDEYNEYLNIVAPIIYSIDLEKAVKLGIISPFTIYCLKVNLTDDERIEYKKINNNFIYYKMKLGEFDAFEKATKILKSKESDYNDKREYLESRKNAALFFKAIRERGSVVKNAECKITKTKEIIDKFINRKCLTFSESNKFTDRVFKELKPISLKYHSGMTKKAREISITHFRNNKFKRVLCTTKALNAGFDVPIVSLAIIQGLTSKALTLIQRIGRTVRFEFGKTGCIFILYIEDSQEESWLNNAISKLDKSNIKFINTIEECLIQQ